MKYEIKLLLFLLYNGADVKTKNMNLLFLLWFVFYEEKKTQK